MLLFNATLRGILVWELITGLDITEFQPLAIAQAMQVSAVSWG